MNRYMYRHRCYIYMVVSINGGTTIAGWFIMENTIKMDENWGYPYFRKPSYIYIYRDM